MKIAVILPAGSEALFDRNSQQVFGGANVQMYQIAKELGQCEGVDCYTLIEDYQTIDFDEQGSFKLVKTYGKSDPTLVKFWKYHRQLQKIKPDAILQHGLTFFSALLAIYCKLLGVSFVYMFAHDVEAEGRYQESGKRSPIFKWLLSNAHVLITQNTYQKDQLLKRYGRKSQVVRNGFYLKLTKQSQGDYVLWIARHSTWKRPELFIQLACENPHLQFKMVCPTSMAADYDDLIQKASEVSNLEFVKFVPFDQIDAYFNKAKLVANTSDHEGFPQTFIQATINSLPVLSLNVNPDQVLTDYGFGFCCNGNMDVLNEKLHLIFTDEALYREMSSKAYLYAGENHDIQKNVEQIVGLIVQAR